MTAVHSNPKVLVVLEQDKLLQQLQVCTPLTFCFISLGILSALAEDFFSFLFL